MRVDVDAFDALYRGTDDPWSFATSDYELSRYRSVIEHLSRDRYERCFEPGCSIGVLTRMLAERVADVVACETSPAAIAAAATRTVDLPQVDLHLATIPEWWPEGAFDLIVLSEIGYYWDREDSTVSSTVCCRAWIRRDATCSRCTGPATVRIISWPATRCTRSSRGASASRK